MRAPLDRYDTPAWAVKLLLRKVPELRGRRLFDPCCGDGAMARAVSKSRFDEVLINDIDVRMPADLHWDLRRQALWEMAAVQCSIGTLRASPDWCVTNPPFGLTGDVLRLALMHCKGVALLLRLSALEVCKGRELLQLYPPSRQIVLPRIRFRGIGTDSVTTAWFIWPPVGVTLSGPPILCIGKPSVHGLAERSAA
jgi:hypothetical protein